MKKLTLIIAVLAATFSATAQSSYLIDFTGTGATTTVDSVLVENLVTKAKVKLLGTDVLKLIVTTGIDDVTKANQLELVNFPNPFANQTKVSFYSETNENATVTVNNLAGQMVAQLTTDVQSGKNNFNFSPAAAGVYFVTVTTATGNYSKKVVCSSSNNSNNTLEFVGTEGAKIEEYKQTKQVVQHQLRNAQATIDMVYPEGDRLKFTAYAHAVTGPLVTVMNDVPTSSKTLNFMFIVCMDADSNHYPVVKIGDQYWMAENLKTKTYSNGDTILHAPDTTSWQTGWDGVYCTFADGGINAGPKDGYIYNWFAASHPSDLSPKGWHVPTVEDYDALLFILGQDGFDLTGGGALKAMSGWNDINGFDFYGFSGVPAGDRWIDGLFEFRGEMGYYWLNSENDDQSSPLFWELYGGDQQMWTGLMTPYLTGYSIRCIKNP